MRAKWSGSKAVSSTQAPWGVHDRFCGPSGHDLTTRKHLPTALAREDAPPIFLPDGR
jgi:hypothetical protein